MNKNNHDDLGVCTSVGMMTNLMVMKVTRDMKLSAVFACCDSVFARQTQVKEGKGMNKIMIMMPRECNCGNDDKMGSV